MQIKNDMLHPFSHPFIPDILQFFAFFSQVLFLQFFFCFCQLTIFFFLESVFFCHFSLFLAREDADTFLFFNSALNHTLSAVFWEH
uniref:Bm70 n=1 Tax=Brugia malayi TaxID=6279 RepID=A0A1I9G9X2_BRUMA|nr:Bm70 [Brugia malayi]